MLIESRTRVASAGASERPSQTALPDIMDALRKSLEMARKPVASEEHPAKRKRQLGTATESR
jgi:hypothetical protein